MSENERRKYDADGAWVQGGSWDDFLGAPFVKPGRFAVFHRADGLGPQIARVRSYMSYALGPGRERCVWCHSDAGIFYHGPHSTWEPWEPKVGDVIRFLYTRGQERGPCPIVAIHEGAYYIDPTCSADVDHIAPNVDKFHVEIPA